ncbi:uncharacterized protein LOC130770233 isoform X2 [Actinidia eriantha]|uniref:uncharacterized protein LOC130770233 isoform X2 n=1 Tax=Actinidia eriantha TaxID=165200 RepID=UPI00258EE4E8|nr:uncharacterized protein LOC130770233 isoform X2 [Actinidia eriantha]
MGLDVKEMQVCIGRVLNPFLTSSCTYVKKYPVVSGVLFFFFLVYMFLPCVFTFLIFSLPVLVFVTLAFRFIFRIHRQNLEKAKGEKRNCGVCAQKPTFVEDDIVADKDENSSIQLQSVRRRNVKEKEKQVFVQEGVEEKDMFFSMISKDALVDKAALVEENPKEIREVKVDSVVDRAESSSAASQRSTHEHGDRSEGTNKSNGDRGEFEGENSEDEEEAQEEGNKAVEWTEDDQKNLMDLGISEMERNKRLESLIARRRARKLLSMQVRRTLMNASSNDPCRHIASILIPRGNPFPANDSGGAQILPTPGSAPSVLLPMHNPFDIPYDPQEEKPNLTGGSFEEEFIAAHQKDIMFCRHESFSLGAFFPGPGEFNQSRREAFYCPNFSTRQRSLEIPEYSRFRNQSGNENTDKLIQTQSPEECEAMVHINSPDDHGRQEGQGPKNVFDLVDTHHEENQSEVHMEENIVRDVTDGSSSSSSSEVNVPFSIANRDQILKSLSFSVPRNIGVDRECDARRNEVSDGSPPTFEKRRPDECFFYADKGVNHMPTHSIASDLQVEVSKVGSPKLTVDGTISPSDGESLIYEVDVDVEMETTSGSEEMWVASSRLCRMEENESRSREVHEVSERDIIEVGFSRINHKSEDIVASDMPEKAVELPESSETHSTDFDGKVHEEQSDSPEKSAQEVNIIYENDQVVITNDDEDILEFIKNTYGEAQTLTKREAPEELSVLITKNDVKQYEITEGNSGDLDNDHSNSPDYFDEEFKTPSVLCLDTTSHVGSSRANLNSNDSVASVTQPEIVAEQGPNDASSSSSITSVTEEKAPISQASLPIYDQTTQTKVQQIGSEVVDDNFLERRLPKSSNLTVSHDTLHLTEDSATYLCGDRNPGKLQGEHQTTMESRNPVQENANSGSSEDLQKQVIGFSGVSQTFNDPIPSTMQPELVVEQVPMALSSSSSPKVDTHKMVSVEQASSYSFDPETHLKAQKFDENIVEINLLDKLLPESSAPPSPQYAQHLSSNSIAYPSYDKDLEELQEPSNSFQEQNSIYSVKNSKIPANDVENLITIDDTNSEAQELAREENARVLSSMSEEITSNLIDANYIEGQSEKNVRGSNNVKDF